MVRGMRQFRQMTILWWIIGLVAAIAALKIIVVLVEPYMAFVPRPAATPPPPGFQAIELSTADGARLSGWRTEIPSEGAVFVYFCGNAGNLSDREDLMTRAHRSGMAIVAFDYRGTGQSQGRSTEQTSRQDAAAIYRFVTESLGVDPERLVLWGHSIGGAVAAELASNRSCGGIVLEGTFRSAVVMARRMLPFLPVGLFMTYRFDNEANVARLQCPILFIHGRQDMTIPSSDSEFLHGLATGPKELWLVETADHNDIYESAGSEFFARLVQFGQRVVGSRVPVN